MCRKISLLERRAASTAIESSGCHFTASPFFILTNGLLLSLTRLTSSVLELIGSKLPLRGVPAESVRCCSSFAMISLRLLDRSTRYQRSTIYVMVGKHDINECLSVTANTVAHCLMGEESCETISWPRCWWGITRYSASTYIQTCRYICSTVYQTHRPLCCGSKCHSTYLSMMLTALLHEFIWRINTQVRIGTLNRISGMFRTCLGYIRSLVIPSIEPVNHLKPYCSMLESL